jgi:predicted ATPase
MFGPGAPDLARGHLPRQLTSFIGREHELAELKGLLERSRLLTLTGPGGSGKTRLGLQLAAEAADGFPDGVYFVALAPVGHPDLVLSSIAQGIGLRDEGDRPLPDRLCSYLEHARVLILLDNFEHLIAAAPAVTQVLQATLAPRIMVTSRAPLHVSGEQEYEVPPLQVPDPESATVAAVAGCESVRLFTERARAVRPGFALDEDNAGTIAAIARRLDGLPLAVELAAARVKLLPPASLEVASLVAAGLTNRSIAGRLCLSVRTVDTHVDHILTKLGFSNRARLVAWAYESGLAPKDG